MTGISCYRNLNRKGVVWSIRSNRTGRVISRAGFVMILNAKLVVSAAGRARVLKQKRKNVHALVRGTWIRNDFDQHVYDTRGCDDCRWIRIKYNPYENEAFVRQDTGQPVTEAACVILDKDGAWAVNPK